MKNLLPLFLVLAVTLSCKKDAQVVPTATKPDTVTHEPETDDTDTIIRSANGQPIIDRVDSLTYYKAKAAAQVQKDTFREISDLEEARKLLKGRVVFGDYDEDARRFVENSTGAAILKIIPRKGNPLTIDDFIYFVAYYPEEDILLCEGGHTVDVSYNLTNGNETENTGNPSLIVSSANGSLRLNGWFGGQECYHYFIQRKGKDGFKKIFELTQTIDKLFGPFSLCSAHDAFWQDNVLYILDRENFIPGKQDRPGPVYFRVTVAQ